MKNSILKGIVTTASNKLGRVGLHLSKNSPQICLAVGLGAMTAGAIYACTKTPKAVKIIEGAKAQLEVIEEAKATTQDFEVYSKEDYQKDLMVTYGSTGVKLVLNYAIPTLIFVGGACLLIKGHNILIARNIGLAACLKATEDNFAKYRSRVVEDFGKERDYAYKHGLKAERITETVVNEDGTTSKVKKDVYRVEGEPSMYAVMFDKEHAKNWSPGSEFYNYSFLKMQQQLANDMLQLRGHVFLNEVYDMLGVKRQPFGQVVGWVKGKGDNFIDFDMYDKEGQPRAFMNQLGNTLLLDFNVHGRVLDLI